MDIKNHHFWTWFLENHERIATLRTLDAKEQKQTAYWLDWHLHFYSPGLDYLLVFHEKGNQQIELIITANGDPEFFETVETLICDAPQLSGWTYTAFIQPSRDYEEMEQGLDEPYVFQDITLKTSDLSFVPLETNRAKIDMVVYLKNFTVYSKNKNLLQLIFIMLQDLLGEKVRHQDIGFVQLAQLTDDRTDLVKLHHLGHYLDQINKERKGDL